MNLHQRYGLTRVINAAGSFTPVGVSRSSPAVADAVARALGEFFVVDELQSALSRLVASMTGAEAGAVTHCASAAITLSVAATMTGDDSAAVAALPDAGTMPNRVVIPAGHVIDYGHPILTDIRLAGAAPVIAGDASSCTVRDLEQALGDDRCACLLLVSSRLIRDRSLDHAEAVAAAHRRGVPAIIDGAAQDLRIDQLLATGADLVLVSAQKYLAAPTAGLIVGRESLVRACRAHERGIGRAMKATKEAIVGVLAALEQRRGLDLPRWRDEQASKLRRFVEQANTIAGISASEQPDPAGMPFSRACLRIDPVRFGRDATALADALRAGQPSIWVIGHALADGQLVLELVPLRDAEIGQIVERLTELGAKETPGPARA